VLVELRLENLAVAADVQLVLERGLNVLTGSTGAGKSLAVEALRWIRGEKIDPGLLRAGADEAAAEALFDLSQLPEAARRVAERGVAVSPDGVLRLRRQWRDGRSRAWIDGSLTSAALLRDVCDELVEVQSQHQQLALLDGRAHAALLDAHPDLAPLRRAYRQAWRGHRDLVVRAQSSRERHQQLREQSELLRYQWQELRDAALEIGEAERLRADVARLEGGAQLARRVEEAREDLEDEESGVLTRLHHSVSRLMACSDEIPSLVEARDDLSAALDLIEEARRRVVSFTADLDLSPELLDEKHSRLAEIEGLCRKYARNESELIAFAQRLERDVENLELGQEIPAELERALEESRDVLQSTASQLHRARQREARRIERGASALLEELGMPGAALRFEFEVRTKGEAELRIDGRRSFAQSDGPTRVRLLVRTNPGESFGPIETTASGGELSRIGLVLQSLAAHRRRPSLLLLDEVDAGLGADLGPALARRLRALADRGQVLVITHLPAVAAVADVHLLAEKRRQGGRTLTEVRRLDSQAHEEEMVRMIGGAREPARAVARRLRKDLRGEAGAA
jgi:DNA repair protein RecN (Recombination protein N)